MLIKMNWSLNGFCYYELYHTRFGLKQILLFQYLLLANRICVNEENDLLSCVSTLRPSLLSTQNVTINFDVFSFDDDEFIL